MEWLDKGWAGVGGRVWSDDVLCHRPEDFEGLHIEVKPINRDNKKGTYWDTIRLDEFLLIC